MEMDGLDEVYKFQRFLPTAEEAVGYFLPHLLRGETMHRAEKLILHAQVYASEEPKDLAKRFAPVPTAVTSGDRFFFTTCKRNAKNGRCARGAGAGTWEVQKTEDVCVYDDEGLVKIGETRTLSFKKGKGVDKVSTGWVMVEYRCLLPEAVVAQGEMVLCRIHLAQNAPPAARQESDAYRLRRQEPAEQAPAPPQPAEPVAAVVTASAHAQKRPAPVSAAADMSSCKKMRSAAPVPVPEPEEEYEDCPVWPAAPVPKTLPTASREVPEADDHTESCTWEELFGEERQEEPTDQDVDQFMRILFGDDEEEAAELQKNRCNHNADLQGQHNQFSFAAVTYLNPISM